MTIANRIKQFLIKLINFFVIINTLGIIILGIYNTQKAVAELFGYIVLDIKTYRPGLKLLESIDILMVSLVFIVFSIGINLLFIRYDDKHFINSTPKWMRVKNFSQLKFLLMEAVIATLFILLISAFIQKKELIDWEFLAFPITILVLALSLKILNPNNKNS